MKLGIYCVRDSAAGLFGMPMFMPAEGVARRWFSDEVNRAATDNQIFQHPDDFTLFCIGSFDALTGVIASEVVELVRGKDVAVRVDNVVPMRGVN